MTLNIDKRGNHRDQSKMSSLVADWNYNCLELLAQNRYTLTVNFGEVVLRVHSFSFRAGHASLFLFHQVVLPDYRQDYLIII